MKDKLSRSNLILEAAQKRFGLYGVEKTSMREIADDLKLSKASLYYYFPDKECLYKSVIEKEQNEFLSKIKTNIQNIKDPAELLREYAVTRLSYFRTLMNLSRLRFESFSNLKPVFSDIIQKFRDNEKSIIIKILNKGIETEIFSIKNTDKIASLFLDVLRGLRITLINSKQMLYIDEKEFELLLNKTIDFTDVFIKGLKSK